MPLFHDRQCPTKKPTRHTLETKRKTGKGRRRRVEFLAALWPKKKTARKEKWMKQRERSRENEIEKKKKKEKNRQEKERVAHPPPLWAHLWAHHVTAAANRKPGRLVTSPGRPKRLSLRLPTTFFFFLFFFFFFFFFASLLACHRFVHVWLERWARAVSTQREQN